MGNIEDFYKEKILTALAQICVEARTGGFNEGLKVGMEIKDNKYQNEDCNNIDKNNDSKVIGKNNSIQEYKSEINKSLGILGE